MEKRNQAVTMGDGRRFDNQIVTDIIVCDDGYCEGVCHVEHDGAWHGDVFVASLSLVDNTWQEI